ncbi:MAG: B12-binding domain-containing radical SAM protein [Planctomycetes bacterium]|nr:B12-binding domain-containing radical SAM protein [Planctomycetota bacterium]
MRHALLLALPALQEVLSDDFRQIKYSLFPPLTLLTLAGLTPEDRYRIIVRDEHVEPAVVEEHVDIVAMTVYVSSAYRAYELAEVYRRRGAKVVLGGIHPSTLPQEAARHADAVCIGPAERAWPQILCDFENGSLRKFYRGAPGGSASLVPLPRRDLMNQKAYLVRNTMVTSRGCPHSCNFCYKSSFWGDRFYERRPLADVEHELSLLKGNFVFFLDDNFLGNRRRAREIFQLLKGSGMVWQAAASLDAAQTPVYLEEAYDAGCRSLFVGFESLSDENMRRSNKSINAVADYARAIRRFHDAGMMINASFVFGFDCDGPDVFDRTLEFAIENKLETATFHVLTPFPGTRLFAQMEAGGRLLHRDWRLYDTRHAVFRPAHMKPEALEKGYWRSYDEFYRYGSIFRRSVGMPNALKRILYNIVWRKCDRLWAPVIRHGLLPAVRPAFEYILAQHSRSRTASTIPASGRTETAHT